LSRGWRDAATPESRLEDPLQSLQTLVACHARDWSLDPRDAWLYGIVCGWDYPTLLELSARHGWNSKALMRLERLHARFVSLRTPPPPRVENITTPSDTRYCVEYDADGRAFIKNISDGPVPSPPSSTVDNSESSLSGPGGKSR
jgi:hypothetical protein